MYVTVSDTDPSHEPDESKSSCLRPILILSSTFDLGVSSGLFRTGFVDDGVYIFFIPPMRATCFALLSEFGIYVVLWSLLVKETLRKITQAFFAVRVCSVPLIR